MQSKLIVAFFACCSWAGIPFVHAQPAEVVVRQDGAGEQNAQSAQAIEGLHIAAIEISGINQPEQLKNAQIFLTLMKSQGETVKQPDYIHYLIENGKEEIALRMSMSKADWDKHKQAIIL